MMMMMMIIIIVIVIVIGIIIVNMPPQGSLGHLQGHLRGSSAELAFFLRANSSHVSPMDLSIRFS